MIITMDGKYAYRGRPHTQVRVLCVDRFGGEPVLTIEPNGMLHEHLADGRFDQNQLTSVLDLVPLDESLVVTPGFYRTRDGTLATICYIRQNAVAGYAAIGWWEGSGTAADSWRLDGAFSRQNHRLDLVERVGDLP